MIDVSIIIVNYKYRVETLKKCLNSIVNSEGVTYEVLFVDNSPDAPQEELVRSYDHMTYIPNDENVGFARAVNQGMRQAKGKYMLLLNGDVSFEKDVLATMCENLKQDSVGIASSLITYPNGELQDSIRRFPTPWNQLQVLLKLPHFWKTKSFKHYMAFDLDPYRTQEVESIMGAFMWITRETIEKIGLFDENFFLWFEEVDYCHRAHKAGIAIKHYADIQVRHEKGASFSTVQTWKKQVWMRQSLRWYMKKHYGMGAWAAFIVLQPIFLGTAALAHFVKRH